MSTASTAQALQDDAKYIASFSHLSEVPLVVASAHGSYLVGADGREYLDFISGACTMSMGYDKPKETMAYGSFPFPYALGLPQLEYAKALIRHFPGGSDNIKAYFGVCGSEAVDGAIKLCRAFTKRKKIVTFSGDYHGTTFGAVSLTTMPGRISDKFDPLLPEVAVLPFCDEEASDDDIDNCLLQLAYMDYESIAGFIIEPVQGDMGMVPMHQKLMQSIYSIAKTWGIAFVVDEIQMALHRTGPFFSIENYDGIIPDAVIMGKSIGGGIPLSCIMG
ncbi:MAG: aminotransferase class III-fold pyridoxal phosphate-dependent enzyme, partial [Proteobacteria bacterium]|nr:aminotransferase class III-fold pyridoxal phosphate-dependent enzyme [Candidatus Avisuccinivibrio stercorigallinarum]